LVLDFDNIRCQAALRSFETALKLDTGFRECLINLAQNYRDEGKVEEALKYFARAIAIPSPKNTPLYTNAQDLRGILLYLSGDITKSIEDFSFVLAHTPKHKSSLQMRGTVKSFPSHLNFFCLA
jgi:tetratricopeptide (TPR) repeat protein